MVLIEVQTGAYLGEDDIVRHDVYARAGREGLRGGRPMAPKFRTSGCAAWSELTDALVADHVRAFLSVCATGPAILLGRDLRDARRGWRR